MLEERSWADEDGEGMAGALEEEATGTERGTGAGDGEAVGEEEGEAEGEEDERGARLGPVLEGGHDTLVKEKCCGLPEGETDICVCGSLCVCVCCIVCACCPGGLPCFTNEPDIEEDEDEEAEFERVDARAGGLVECTAGWLTTDWLCMAIGSVGRGVACAALMLPDDWTDAKPALQLGLGLRHAAPLGDIQSLEVRHDGTPGKKSVCLISKTTDSFPSECRLIFSNERRVSWLTSMSNRALLYDWVLADNDPETAYCWPEQEHKSVTETRISTHTHSHCATTAWIQPWLNSQLPTPKYSLVVSL